MVKFTVTSTMKEFEKKELKEKIRQELIQLTHNINELKEFTKPIAPENAIGRISRMDAINNKSVNDAALVKAEQRLKLLEIALSKIDSSEFGICRICGNPIPEGRLLFRPESSRCINCAD